MYQLSVNIYTLSLKACLVNLQEEKSHIYLCQEDYQLKYLNLTYNQLMLLTVLYLFRRARGSRNPVKNLMARKDLVIREEDLKSSEDKENKNKVNLLSN